jgi:hypothetical protein
MRRIFGIGAIAFLAAQPLAAQTPTDALVGSLTATVGAATFSSRDGTTTDASPMAWEGAGETLAFRYERSRPARLHRFDVGFSTTGRFTYESPLRSTAADASDSARWINGQYEYRLRILGRWLPDRINTGIGAQARGGFLAISRHLAPSIENDERELRVEGAAVLAARVRVYRHVTIEGAWAPGFIRLARISLQQSADADVSIVQRAIGWSAETSLRADVPITPRTSIVVDYLRTSDETDSHFHSFTAQTNRFACGVRYGR